MKKDNLLALREKAKDLANEITRHNMTEKGLNNQAYISKELRDNNKAVREILLQRGVRPEDCQLPKM